LSWYFTLHILFIHVRTYFTQHELVHYERGEWIGSLVWLAVFGLASILLAYMIMASLDLLNERSIVRFTQINQG
jgi:hypothetical protein